VDFSRCPADGKNPPTSKNTLTLSMEEYLKFLITPLLSVPKDLEILSSAGTFTLKVAPEDVGRIIGKHGNMISALRTLLRTYNTLHRQPPVNLILDTPPAPGPEVKKDS